MKKNAYVVQFSLALDLEHPRVRANFAQMVEIYEEFAAFSGDALFAAPDSADIVEVHVLLSIRQANRQDVLILRR